MGLLFDDPADFRIPLASPSFGECLGALHGGEQALVRKLPDSPVEQYAPAAREAATAGAVPRVRQKSVKIEELSLRLYFPAVVGRQHLGSLIMNGLTARYDWTMLAVRYKGTACPNFGLPVITRQQQYNVHRAFKAGFSRYEIAERMQLSYQCVGRVIRDRSPDLFSRRLHAVKKLLHIEALLRNRVRKAEQLVKVSAHLIRRMQPSARKRAQLGAAVQARFKLSRADTNRVVGVAALVGHSKLNIKTRKEIVADMERYFHQNPGQGFIKVFDAMLKGQPYRQEQLKEIYKRAKQDLAHRSSSGSKSAVPSRVKRPMQVQTALDDMWSMDFMTDVTSKGERFWILNILDDFNREALASAVSRRRSTKMVVHCLKLLQQDGRVPKAIRSDNGGEFKGLEYAAWAKLASVNRVYIRPGSPTENVLIERFNLTMRQEVFDRYILDSIPEASRMLEDWRVRYNLARPHYSLGGLSPLQYSALMKPARQRP